MQIQKIEKGRGRELKSPQRHYYNNSFKDKERKTYMTFSIKTHKVFSSIMLILIILEIFYISSLTFGPSNDQGIAFIPIVYHFTIFFLLSFFILTLIREKGPIKKIHILATLLASISFALLDEIHQFFVPFRSCSIEDIVVDGIGISLAIIIHKISELKKKKLE